jgi:hypothetical protein
MDDQSGNFADEAIEMVSETPARQGEELRKRRSTRIVQAVPLAVTGVDALGRPFTERTSTLIINCHGCRYQSKHYVLKNMWVSLEVPHSEAGQPPRTTRGRVVWIQRPRTVRQLFQVALELEAPGNAWGIAFPPQDWFPFPEGGQVPAAPEAAQDASLTTPEAAEIHLPLTEAEPQAGTAQDNLRMFPAPLSATDVSLQLSRHMARLMADAKEQIQAAAREVAAQAVGAERRLSFDEWEHKLAESQAGLARQVSSAIEKIQQESDSRSRAAQVAAAEAVQRELPQWIAPQLEELTRELTKQISDRSASEHSEHAQQITAALESLRSVCQQAEETGVRLRTQAEQAQSQFATQSETARRTLEETSERLRVQSEQVEVQFATQSEATKRTLEETTARLNTQAERTEAQFATQSDAIKCALEETAARLGSEVEQAEAQSAAQSEATSRALAEATRQQEEALAAQREALRVTVSEIQGQVATTLGTLHQSWQSQLNKELQEAQGRWNATIEASLAASKEQAISGLNEHSRALRNQAKEETGSLVKALRESMDSAAAEAQQKLDALRDSLQEQSQSLQSALARANEATGQLDQFSTRIEATQEHALGRFQSQLDDVLSLHRNELHRSSESLMEGIHERIHTAFEENLQRAVSRFDQQIELLVQPHMSKTEEAIHRLAGGRSLLDAALTLQQDRIRASADEAFAEALARFRENLGGVDQLLQDAAQTAASRNLADLESKMSELKHQAIDDLVKSAEWYEKKAQTQIHGLMERAEEEADTQLREKAGEVSSVFASELDNSSRSFIRHAQNQMEESVRESFERARTLFGEAADTTLAAFTDEVQRHARQELDGFGEELQRSVAVGGAQLEAARGELARKVTADQEDFLRRFGTGMHTTVELGIAEANQRVKAGFAPLLESWKSMVEAHQKETGNVYAQLSHLAAEQHRGRLENISNQWMLATAATLDHRSREAVSSIAEKAEQKLRETCAQVFAGMGDTLKERLQQIAVSFKTPVQTMSRSQSAGGS